MNYYEHHLGDYAEATSHLSFIEDAAYSRCIRKYYAAEAPLPHDIKAVQRLIGARSKEERDAVETVLKEFFTLEADGWHNHRCDEEISRYKDKRTKAKSSADARWNAKRSQSHGNANEEESQCERIADAMPTHCEGNALQSPVSNPQSPDSSKNARFARVTRAREAWQRIRETYPPGIYREADWLLAEREFERLVEADEDPDAIANLVTAYRAQQEAKQALGSQFVLSPAKFFADKRWRGPFPLPATKADTRLAANVSAAEEFMRRTEVAQ